MISPNGELVQEYLRKYPSYSSHRLSKMITTAAPGAFRSPESCRDIIRYYRGTHGSKMRANLAPESFVPKITMPDTDAEPWQAVELQESDFPLIAGGDIHVPYHDQDILEMFIERAIQMKAKTVLLMGDFIDCYQLSRFVKDPRKRHTVEEVRIARDILARIRKALPSSRIIWKLGNHEERYEVYLMSQAPELFDLDVMSFENVLHLKESRIELVRDKRLIKYKQLHFIHGHEYAGGISSPVNPARMLFLKAKKPAIEWHFHQSSEHTGKAINDDTTTCWSVGAMCDLHPDYRPLNEWCHGFAEVTVIDGFWIVNNRKILNYRYY